MRTRKGDRTKVDLLNIVSMKIYIIYNTFNPVEDFDEGN